MPARLGVCVARERRACTSRACAVGCGLLPRIWVMLFATVGSTSRRVRAFPAVRTAPRPSPFRKDLLFQGHTQSRSFLEASVALGRIDLRSFGIAPLPSKAAQQRYYPPRIPLNCFRVHMYFALSHRKRSIAYARILIAPLGRERGLITGRN